MQTVQRAVEQVADLRESHRHNGWALAVESSTRATLYIRRGRQVAYAGRIGFAATSVDLTREKTKASPWTIVPESEETVLWPLGLDEDDVDNVPHPAEVMTWLGWHEPRALREIVERCYGIAATTGSAWTFRAYIGSAYQVTWMEMTRRPVSSTYRARLHVLTLLLTKNTTDEDARVACERAANDRVIEGEDDVIEEIAEIAVGDAGTEPAKQPIVKKKKVVVPKVEREPSATPPLAIKRRGRPPGKAADVKSDQDVSAPAKKKRRKKSRRKTARRARPKQIEMPDGTDAPILDVRRIVGTYHGRNAPPEGFPVVRIGTTYSNGRVRVELANGTTVTCAEASIVRAGETPDVNASVAGNEHAAVTPGRPSRLIVATRELTRQVLVAVRNGEEDVLTVMLPRVFAFALIGYVSCEFCAKPAPAEIRHCDACATIKAHIEQSPLAARKILRRIKGMDE